eukprot:CAMPEP_0205896872 /NCGR_PEP_ID=MMETSP1083-20121108/25193_1 /ASSEMBLY_ACC=CAM_ASM_000430 /TAXON_ID=97485 /ORGANISM="Prymnesium parvum, Strain Texoma1" /LENGTH=111 /DNA_ID=CAMNT_0053261989 /DNA_START=323 /DNA_END=656 /DNA_ORIENTATION=+
MNARTNQTSQHSTGNIQLVGESTTGAESLSPSASPAAAGDASFGVSTLPGEGSTGGGGGGGGGGGELLRHSRLRPVDGLMTIGFDPFCGTKLLSWLHAAAPSAALENATHA